MKVIYKAPGCQPEPRDIPNTLEELQAAVGGYIETVTIASDVVIICNEEGRLQGLPHNCRIFGVDFFGPILIAGVDEDEFSDLDAGAMGALLDGLGEVNQKCRNLILTFSCCRHRKPSSSSSMTIM